MHAVAIWPQAHPILRRHPPAPTCCHLKMAANLKVELTAMLSIVQAHAKLAEFLLREGILDTDAVALLAGSEDKLEEKIFPMLKAGGVPVEQLKEQVAIKKLWCACRAKMNEPQKATETGGHNEGLALATKANLVTSFKSKHGFAMSGERLLSEQLIKKLHDGIFGDPCRLDIHLMESLRLQSALSSSQKIMIPCEIRPGVPIVPEVISAEAVQSVMQTYERTHAFFGTLAWVAVNKGDWFTYQDFHFIDDRMLEMLQWTKDGRRPPLNHYVVAWAQMQRFFSDSIRTSDQSLGPLVRETSSWSHFWTSWTPSPNGHQPPAAGSNREAELQRMLDAARTERNTLKADLHKEKSRGRNGAGSSQNGYGGNAYRPQQQQQQQQQQQLALMDRNQRDQPRQRERSPYRDQGRGDRPRKGGKGGKGGSGARRR